ncbi:hypothetical protein GCM10007853_29520 [Algimonas ampicilliniresistens]|uniref:Uncharacterized protein n=2 Tax=Algimonas ampicilliniresistens TaxID=1298735 RepID=A0ABQ5VCE5_9PROT|nr:hypothetical protein GCM10007853_29520 [Algimonas ampicilliniresistens]
MTRSPFIPSGMKTLAVLFAALFMFAQGMAQAHVVEFGASHEHDGVACTVSVLGEDQAIAPVPLETETVPVDESPVITLRPTKTVTFQNAHPCRAPPPRAPPH